MFKIIKTSTYDELLAYKEIAIKQDEKIISFTKTMQDALSTHIKLIRENGELKQELHHLTAKKLPIKK